MRDLESEKLHHVEMSIAFSNTVRFEAILDPIEKSQLHQE